MLASGCSIAAVADASDLTPDWIYDLLDHPGEFQNNVSVASLRKLGDLLGIDPVWLLSGVPSPIEAAEDALLQSCVERYLAAPGNSIERLEAKFGYSLKAADGAWAQVGEQNMDGLEALCDALSVDWRLFLTRNGRARLPVPYRMKPQSPPRA